MISVIPREIFLVSNIEKCDLTSHCHHEANYLCVSATKYTLPLQGNTPLGLEKY